MNNTTTLQYLPTPYTRDSLNRLLVTDDAARGFYGLRAHVRQLGTVPCVTVAGMNREQCIGVLLGEENAASLELDPRHRAPLASRVSVPGDAAANLAKALADAMAQQSTPLDESAVNELIHSAMRNGAFPEDRVETIVSRMLADRPAARFEVKVGDAPAVEVKGHRHFQFCQVLTWLIAGVPLWLWGGAGAGKTTMARQLAEALNVPAYVVSIDPTATMGKLIGFRNLVTGEFVEGLLYKPFRDGGLVCLDEIDTGDASILAGLNSLLANEFFLFPNGETVSKHPAFYVMAGANTKGTGAVGWFSARVKLDGATLDRFACVELRYDEGLELALCCGGDSTSATWAPAVHDEARCAKWVKWVQQVRGTVGNALLVSPRASLNGCKALRAGVPVAEVAESLVFKLAHEDTKKAILSRCGNPVEVLA